MTCPLIHLARTSAAALAAISLQPASVAAAAASMQAGSRASESTTVIRRATGRGTHVPAERDFINAAAVLPWAEGRLYRVFTAPERVTDIALQPGENLVAVASGDTVRWVIGDTSSGAGPDSRVHILVKPHSPGLSTNLVITTDRRTYHVALTSSGGAAMTAVSWSYPAEALVAVQGAASGGAAARPGTGLDLERLNFGYEISGHRPSWRPTRAFDDGRQTFIEFPPSIAVGEAPPLFAVDGSGDPQLVNYRVRGRFYVVDRLFDAAELRLGTRRQQVVRINRVGGGNR